MIVNKIIIDISIVKVWGKSTIIGLGMHEGIGRMIRCDFIMEYFFNDKYPPILFIAFTYVAIGKDWKGRVYNTIKMINADDSHGEYTLIQQFRQANMFFWRTLPSLCLCLETELPIYSALLADGHTFMQLGHLVVHFVNSCTCRLHFPFFLAKILV